MANHFFKFKQFTVQQEKCAMKVCTDACLFGSLLPVIKQGWALDIGTGTGLLSLMYAQKTTDIQIDTIEIDEDAFEQARENVSNSPWEKNIHLHYGDIKFFGDEKKYDLVFSNPPFYANDLKSTDNKRNIAMHTTQLHYDELIAAVVNLLNKNGLFAVLLPFAAAATFAQIAKEYALYINEMILVKQTENHHYFRAIIIFSFSEIDYTEKEITIKINGNYSVEFTELLQPFYLAF